jgi:predicted RNase H-like HicB family nuclease
MSLKFTTTYHKEGKWYVAYCPELGVTSQGKTLEEAQKNIREAVELYVEDIPKKELSAFFDAPFVKTLEIITA